MTQATEQERGARHGPVGVLQRQHAQRELVVRQVLRRELLLRPVPAARRRLAVVREGDEVVAPGHELALRVDAARERVESADAEEVLRHVLLAGPHQLDRALEALRDRAGLADIVIHEAPAEAAAHAGLVDLDLRHRHAECGSHGLQRAIRRLGGRPELDHAVVRPGRAVLRFERRVRNEWIGVERLDRFRGALQGLVHRALADQRLFAGRLLAQLGRAFDQRAPAVLRRAGLVPFDAQLACAPRRPPRWCPRRWPRRASPRWSCHCLR